LTFISKKNPLFKEDNINHEDVGKKLGYLTPIELNNEKGKRYYIQLNIKFTNNGNKPLNTYILNQVVVNKSEKEINEYLDNFITGIKKLPIPKQFKIIQISKEIIKK
jgi:hypothetical protein